jgi:hypothetical protein
MLSPQKIYWPIVQSGARIFPTGRSRQRLATGKGGACWVQIPKELNPSGWERFGLDARQLRVLASPSFSSTRVTGSAGIDCSRAIQRYDLKGQPFSS